MIDLTCEGAVYMLSVLGREGLREVFSKIAHLLLRQNNHDSVLGDQISSNSSPGIHILFSIDDIRRRLIFKEINEVLVRCIGRQITSRCSLSCFDGRILWRVASGGHFLARWGRRKASF